MGKMSMDRSQSTLVDELLRDDMARGNRALRSVAPVVVHMLDMEGASLFSDAILARLKGMLNSIVDQLLFSDGSQGHRIGDQKHAKRLLSGHLANDERLIDHLYAVALEGVLTEKLRQIASIDPVLPPLVQELVASQQSDTAGLAMSVLAAQSRFCQNQSRMELPLGELPFELFGAVLDHVDAPELDFTSHQLDRSVSQLRTNYDESSTRLALFARLVSTMQNGAVAALDLDHAGLALFASAAASLTRQQRGHVVFACHESQPVRLALILKAAGQSAKAVTRQVALLGVSRPVPEALMSMSQSHAQSSLREMSGV